MRARISDIITFAANLSGMGRAAITGNNRRRDLVAIRCAVTVVARDARHSFPKIGAALGGRDHSSIIHYMQTRDVLQRKNPGLLALIQQLRGAVYFHSQIAKPFTAVQLKMTAAEAAQHAKEFQELSDRMTLTRNILATIEATRPRNRFVIDPDDPDLDDMDLLSAQVALHYGAAL